MSLFRSFVSDYEKLIGYNDVKTVDSNGVFFHVSRSSTYRTAQSYVRYESVVYNYGGAMNIHTGIFTAPVQGRYHFSFNGLTLKEGSEIIVQLMVNHGFLGGYRIASAFSNVNDDPVTVSGTVSLFRGDRVSVWLEKGRLYDSGWGQYTHFTGILLEEDLTL